MPEDEDIKVGSVIYVHNPHFDFQRHFRAEEYFIVKLYNICDRVYVSHQVVDDILNLMRKCKEKGIKFQPGCFSTKGTSMKDSKVQYPNQS